MRGSNEWKRKSAEQITDRRIMRPWDKDNKVLSDDLPTVDLRFRLFKNEPQRKMKKFRRVTFLFTVI